MAGHSHGANIRFRKDRVDAKKAKAFAKLALMITVAAKGGGDPDGNARLRLAIDKARVLSMPKDVIERAIKKGTGSGAGGDFEEVLYEGYAPHGVALLLEILTDNRHRTAAEVRLVFDRYGGNLGASGSVSWMFERKGVVRVPKAAGLDPDRLLEIASESGADDLIDLDDAYELRCPPSALEPVRTALAAGTVTIAESEQGWLPKTTVRIDTFDEARKVLACIDSLEENDDVQNVASNYDFADDVLAALSAET